MEREKYGKECGRVKDVPGSGSSILYIEETPHRYSKCKILPPDIENSVRERSRSEQKEEYPAAVLNGFAKISKKPVDIPKKP